MSTQLKKFSARVKRVRARHPNMTFRAAQKMCSKNPSAGKVSGTATRSKRPKAKRRAPARRRKVGGVSPMRAAIISGTGTVSSHLSAARHGLKEQLGWMLVNITQAKTKTAKRKLAKRAAVIKKKLRALC